jgi:sugar fermentation stimulation protein A
MGVSYLAAMNFSTPLIKARFLRREKRFFIYAELDGEEVVAHCPNTGSLKGVLEHTAYVWLLEKDGGKLKYSAEIAEFEDGTLVGIHPARANGLAREAWESGITGLQDYRVTGNGIKGEVKYDADTRFDFKIGETWVEVKSVSMAKDGPLTPKGAPAGKQCALFPDAVSSRGLKHLGILSEVVINGGSALQLYVVQRADCTEFRPAELIDPAYAAGLRAAMAAGVQIKAVACEVTAGGIRVSHEIPVKL